MTVRKIATSIPAEQYRALERVRRVRKLNRSQAVQRALELWLASQAEDPRVQQYIRAYSQHPEDTAEARAFAEAWAKGQPKEEW